MNRNKTRTPYIKKRIVGDYEDFDDFYETNKKDIYLNTIKVFEGFKNNKKRVLSLYYFGLVNYLSWEAEFIINRKDKNMLIDFIIPYFENIEEYELCSEILKLYNEI